MSHRALLVLGGLFLLSATAVTASHLSAQIVGQPKPKAKPSKTKAQPKGRGLSGLGADGGFATPGAIGGGSYEGGAEGYGYSASGGDGFGAAGGGADYGDNEGGDSGLSGGGYPGGEGAGYPGSAGAAGTGYPGGGGAGYPGGAGAGAGYGGSGLGEEGGVGVGEGGGEGDYSAGAGPASGSNTGLGLGDSGGEGLGAGSSSAGASGYGARPRQSGNGVLGLGSAMDDGGGMSGGMASGSMGGMGSGYPSMSSSSRNRNPSMNEVRRRLETLKAEFKRASDNSERNRATSKIRAYLAQYFDRDMVARQAELDAVKRRVAELEQLMRKRASAKNTIIDSQLQTTIREAQGLGFFRNQLSSASPRSQKGFSNQAFSAGMMGGGYPNSAAGK